MMMSRVAVKVTPGVKSLQFTIRRPLVRRYTTLLITIKSVAGWTITVTVAVFVRPVIELVAVTWKVKDCAGVSCGTVPAVKVTGEPVVDDSEASGGSGVSGVQVKVELHGVPGA